MDKDNSKVIALVGAGMLALGAFLPLVRVPKMGTISYMGNGSGDGIIILLLAAAAAGLALMGRTKHVIWPGLASLGLIAFTFFGLQARLSEARSKIREEAGDNPFGGLAEAATNAIQLEFGWAVLVLGALGLIAAGILAWRRRGPGRES